MTSQLTPGVEYEANPFAPTLPVNLGDINSGLSDYLQNQTESLRAQHNYAQAGDSTFPWEIATKFSAKAFYHVGSLGRFVHTDYGLIRARYCQFESPNAMIWTGSPVGFLLGPDGLKWKVTNSLAASDKELLVGQQAGFTTPTSGQFGWVVVDGVNLQSLLFYADAAPIAGTKLAWTGDGKVQDESISSATGDVLGVVVDTSGITLANPGVWDLPPASVRITIGAK